jgi:hypothetical protein
VGWDNFAIRTIWLKHALRLFLLVGAVALLGMPITGCGSGKENRSTSVDASGSTNESSPYVTVLREFRDAVKAKASYDAYGYAEYLPPTQRAAIDAFCFIADQVLKNPSAMGLHDPAHFPDEITRKAESDLKSERSIVAPRPARRAIGRLRAVLGLESLDSNLAGRYVTGCYR